jgi:uncharacterized membrane protein YiaA
MRDYERFRREQRRRELRITILSYGILILGAGVIALGLWATITLLIGAFG